MCLLPLLSCRLYWPKYPEMSKIRWVGLLANALIEPLATGTIAMFEVIAPSSAFSVEATGMLCPCGHNVRYPSEPGRTPGQPASSASSIRWASE